MSEKAAPDLLPRLLIPDLLEAELEVVGRQIDSGGSGSLCTLPAA